MIACNVNEDSHNGRSISWKPFLISSARLKQTKMHYRLYTISSNRGWLYGNHKLSGSSNVTWIMGWRSFDVIFDFNSTKLYTLELAIVQVTCLGNMLILSPGSAFLSVSWPKRKAGSGDEIGHLLNDHVQSMWLIFSFSAKVTASGGS